LRSRASSKGVRDANAGIVSELRPISRRITDLLLVTAHVYCVRCAIPEARRCVWNHLSCAAASLDDQAQVTQMPAEAVEKQLQPGKSAG
jgi:hypothetical protein